MKYLMVGFSLRCVLPLSVPSIAAVLLSGCVSVGPVENDVRLGEVVSAQMVETSGIVHRRPTAEYVDAVGERLVSAIPGRKFDYEFRILDRPEANLFGLPGGHVYITRGLLVMTNSEEELANLLAHGIAHVERRHTAEQMAADTGPAFAPLPGRVADTVISDDLGNTTSGPVDLLTGAYLAAYGGSQENDADRFGQEIAAAAGYDPGALAGVLRRLETGRDLFPAEPGRVTFLDTHPAEPGRVENVEKRAAGLTVAASKPIANGRAAYLANLEGLIVGQNPEMGVFIERHYLNPDRDIAVSFPENWATFHTPKHTGAMAPEGGGMVFMAVLGREENPREAARIYCGKLAERLGGGSVQTPELTEIHGLPACWANLVDRSGDKPVDVHFVWIAHRGVLFHIIAFGVEDTRDAVRRTILSFQPLPENLANRIAEVRLEIVDSIGGETLEGLGARVENAWDPARTAIINGLEVNQPMKEGWPVKVAIRRPYEAKIPSRASVPVHCADVLVGE